MTSTIERAVGTPKSAGGRGELDAGGGEVVAVEFAELVGRDLADEAGLAAQRRDARRGVAGRAAADLARRAHMVVEPRRLVGVDQPHHPLGQPLGCEEGVVAIGDDVDDRIADAEHVEAGARSFESLRCGKARPLAGPADGGQPRPAKSADRHSGPRSTASIGFRKRTDLTRIYESLRSDRDLVNRRRQCRNASRKRSSKRRGAIRTKVLHW